MNQPMRPSLSRASAAVLRFCCAALLISVAAPSVAQMQYSQSTVTTVKTPNAVASVSMATDGKGDIYVANYTNNGSSPSGYVEEIPNGTGGYTEITLPFTGSSYSQLAVDGSGNIYFPGSNAIILETPGAGGTYTSTTLNTSGLASPGQLILDASGNFFVVDYYNGYRLNEESPTGGGNYSHTVLFSSFVGRPLGLGVDAKGAVYVSDTPNSGNSTLYKFTPSGGGFVQSVVGIVPAYVSWLTADPAGNVYAAGQNGLVYKETIGSAGTYTQTIALSEFYSVGSLVVLPDSSLVVSGGYNLLIVKETPIPSAVATSSSFTPVQVAGTPSTGSVQFSFNSAGALAATPYSISNGDYTAASSQLGNACVAGHMYAVGDVCSVGLNFAASAPGTRAGGVALYGSNGQALASATLNGTGISPMALVYPGVTSTLLTGFTQKPTGIVMDAAGNIYLNDPSNNRVLKETLTGGTYVQSIVTTDLSSPGDVAVDGAGNLYIADNGHSRVIKETPYAGGYIESNLLTGYQNYVSEAFDVTVDASGNVYVALYIQNGTTVVITKETPAGGIYTPSTVRSVSLAPYIHRIVADGQGDIFALAENSSNQLVVLAETVTGGVYTETQLSTGNFSGGLSGIAVDNTGSVYVAGANILKIPYSNGSFGTAFSIPGVTESGVIVLAVDALGNIYPVYGQYSPYAVDAINVHQPPTLPFGTYNVGTASLYDPQPVTFVNAGNSSLVFGSPASGTDPAFSLNSYVFDATATCPSATTTSAAQLIGGASCLAAIDFIPRQAGPLNATLTFTDNSLNVSGSKQVVPLVGAGTGGLSISPATLAFASTTVGGTSAVMTATIANSGASVTLTGGALTDAADFTSSNNCGGTVAAGANCTVSFSFTPKSAAALSSTFTIGDTNNSSSTLSVGLSGTGTAAPVVSATLTPTSFNFGSVTPGMASPGATTTFTLTNTGTASLANTFAITGVGANSYSIGSMTCMATLAAGANCSVTVTFAPTAAGSYTASLQVTSVASTQTITEGSALTGTGLTGPTLSATPNPASFADTTVNAAAAGITVTLTNTGQSVLNFGTTIGTLGGADATSFSSGSMCGYNLQPAASCSLSFGFTPNAVRTFNATFTIASNDAKSPTVIQLTGRGFAAGTLSILPVTQVFAATASGSTSAALASTISNTTSQAIYLSSGSLTDATDFTQSDTCNGLLGSNKTCTVTFSFTPKSAAALASTYAIHDLNNPNSPLMVALSGTGTAVPVAVASLAPAALSFSAVAGTTSAAQSFTLSNTGSAPLSIASVALNGTNPALYSETTTCGTSLAVGSSCSIAVSFKPLAAGSFAAGVVVTDNSGGTAGSTQSATLAGTATAVTASDFTIGATPAAQSTYRGTSVSYTVQLASLTGGGQFTSAVTMSVMGLPSGATASFSPATVVPAAGASTTLTVMVPQLSAENTEPGHDPAEREAAIALALLAGFGLYRRRRTTLRLMLLLLPLALLASMATGCGTGTGFAVSTSTSTLTITGAAGATTHATTVTLTVQ